MSDQSGRHVVVIGGGITGLTAAYRLQQAADQHQLPLHCTVVEQSEGFGGKIQTKRMDGFVLELGPDSLLARKPAGINLIRELGVESELVGTNPDPRAQKTYVVRNGVLTPLPSGTNMGIPADLRSFLKTSLLSGPEKLRVLLDLVLPRGPMDADQSVGALLRRRLGDPIVDRLCEPLQAGIYSGAIDQLSLDAAYPQFRELERNYRSLIWGSRSERKKLLQKLNALRKEAAPGAASSAPHRTPPSGAAASRSVFATLRGGLATLIERLYDDLSDRADLLTSSTVTALERDPAGVWRVTIHHAERVDSVLADAVVCALPAPAAARLLAPVVPEAASAIASVEYVSTATVILSYRESQIERALDASGFLVPRKENRAITASTWLSSKWPHTTPAGHVVIRCYVGRAGQEEGLLHSDDAMVDAVRQELQSLIGLTAKPEFSLVTRWHQSMPQYHVGHRSRVQQAEEALSARAPGVCLAGAGYYGMGIPDCIASGQQSAQSVLRHLFGEETPAGKFA